MDPNTCLRLLIDHYLDGHWDDVEDCSDDLIEWLLSGGFTPHDDLIEEFECAVNNTFSIEVLATLTMVN